MCCRIYVFYFCLHWVLVAVGRLSLWPGQGLLLVVNAPGHGIETVAPASASGFLTSGPPGKFRKLLLSVQFSNIKYLHNVVRPLFSCKTLSSSPRETLHPKNNPHTPAPSPWASPWFRLLSASMNLSVLEAPRKWHRTVFVPLCPWA